MLLHAKRFWPKAVAHMLQPFTVAYIIYLESTLAIEVDKRTLLQKLTATNHEITLRDQHTQRCLVYILESKVQISSKGLPKQESRARIGVYLSRSPVYAGNVVMVLNLSSGHVSLQYHIVFDNDFSLIPSLRTNMILSNQADLVTCSTVSIMSDDVDSSKL